MKFDVINFHARTFRVALISSIIVEPYNTINSQVHAASNSEKSSFSLGGNVNCHTITIFDLYDTVVAGRGRRRLPVSRQLEKPVELLCCKIQSR